MRKHVVLLSGGIDSATLLTWVLNHRAPKDLVQALSVDYGQRHRRELEAARLIADCEEVPHSVLDLQEFSALVKGSSQTDFSISVPEGHYTDESMKVTVVPNRNMVLISIAAAVVGEGAVWYAAHSGDHAIYPDCRLEFVLALRNALAVASEGKLELEAPFTSWSKSDIVKYGMTARTRYDLTYSCYCGRAAHCGRCGTCVERREAFVLAGASDPTVYEE